MENTCLNCDYTIDENYCRHCGQKRFKRIDKKYVIDELQYLLIHTNKGFLYSLKKIIKNPGKTAREFIDGNRVNHYKPLLLTFILCGISAFISFKIIGFGKIMEELYANHHLNSPFMTDYVKFTSSYNSIIMLCLIPIFAITTWLAFHKWKNNYYEHVVMNGYIVSLHMIITIALIYPLLYILRNNQSIFMPISSLSFLIAPATLIWFFKGFYPEKPLKQVIWRVLGVLGLTLVAFGILMLILMVLVAIYVFAQGPEGAKYFLPPNQIK